jgi:hypothetical protein
MLCINLSVGAKVATPRARKKQHRFLRLTQYFFIEQILFPEN